MPQFLVYGKAVVNCHAHVEAADEKEAMSRFAEKGLMDLTWGEITVAAEGVDDSAE